MDTIRIERTHAGQKAEIFGARRFSSVWVLTFRADGVPRNTVECSESLLFPTIAGLLAAWIFQVHGGLDGQGNR